MTRDHPSDLELARWATGEANDLAGHLTACDACAERAVAAGIAATPDAGTTPEDRVCADRLLPRLAEPVRGPAHVAWRRTAALAAAGILAAWGLHSWVGRHHGEADPFPSAPRVRGPDGVPSLVVEAGERAVDRTLPDGSRLSAAPRSRLSFSRDPVGGRILKLERGTVTLDVRKDASLFVVSAAGGDVIVTGTRFTVRTFRLTPPRGAAVPVLAAEVHEGRVRLRAGGGIADLAAGQIGLAVGQAPIRMMDAREKPGVFADFAARVAGAGDAGLMAGAAAVWGTVDDPAAFLKAAAASPDPHLRAVAESLARLREAE